MSTGKTRKKINKKKKSKFNIKIIKLNSLLSSLSTAQSRKLAKLVFGWCLDHLGENFRKKHKDLEIQLDYTPKIDYYGEYFIEEDIRLIKIFMNHNKTVKDFISSGLHEYVHDMLPDTKYDVLYKKYGYKNHPHEKKANKIANNFTLICWEDIRFKLNNQICKNRS